MRHERLGFALCGSFCTHKEVLGVLAELCREYETQMDVLMLTSRQGRESRRAKGREDC